jgi:hypothetical protein
MAKAKAAESQKKSGDVLEPLIDRIEGEADEPRNPPSDDDEDSFERDPEDEGPEDSDSDDE